MADTGGRLELFTIIKGIKYGDKYGHFLVFGILSLGFNYLFKLRYFKLLFIRIYWGAVFIFSFTFIEEFSQFYIPRRNVEVLDLVANLIGIIVFSVLTYYLSKIGSKNQTEVKNEIS